MHCTGKLVLLWMITAISFAATACMIELARQSNAGYVYGLVIFCVVMLLTSIFYLYVALRFNPDDITEVVVVNPQSKDVTDEDPQPPV
jgi:hypothetical protein